MEYPWSLIQGLAVTLLDLFSALSAPWRDVLIDLQDHFKDIERKITSESDWSQSLVPIPELIFSALEMTPSEVKVVIVGQDPYPSRTHGIGRAFAVPDTTEPLPGSLKNIFREKVSDVGGREPLPSLADWERSGVMLLNSVLTTRQGESGAHLNIGWQTITRRIIETVANEGAVGLLWGRNASRFSPLFADQVVMGTHPSPLSAHRGFFGSRPFSRVNKLLREPIDW